MKNIPLYEVRSIQNLKDMLETSTAQFGNKPAFLVKSKGDSAYHPISYNQYKADVDAFGTILTHLGLKGKRIALIGENRYEWVVTYLAALNGTGVIVPLDRELPENEIESLLKRSKADAVVFSSYNANQIKNIAPHIDGIEFYIAMDQETDQERFLSFQQLLQKGKQLLGQGDRSFLDATIEPDAMSILLFTSGTTETAKAVMLSHRNITANLMAMCTMLYISPTDIVLSVLPLHHTYECTCGFLCQIYRGSTIAFCEGLRHITKNLEEAKVTVMLGVPLIFEAIYRRIWDQAAKKPGMEKKLKTGIKVSNFLRKFHIDITHKLFAPVHQSFGGSLRLFISGAAGIDPLVAKGFRDLGINIVQGYGLTECAPIVGLNRDVDFKDNAAGLPLPGLQVKIDSPDSEGVGEIIVKGPSVMLGYYENPEATAHVMKDGWFYTGDLGFLDSDGFIHITGRKKNVIVTKNGKNIYPEEIETLLNRSLFIKESLVFGHYDETYGDMIVSAQIVPEDEKVQEELHTPTPTSEQVRELLQKEIREINKSLVLYKYIRDFKLREEDFAKTTTKKIKRYVEEQR